MKLQGSMVVAAFLVTSASGFGQDADKDLGNFQGQWTVIRSERDGKPEPAKVRETFRVTISGGEFLLIGSDGEVIEEGFMFSLDPSRTPKAIDVDVGLPKKVYQGIYLLAEDRLTICIDSGNTGRPKEFSSKDGRSLLVLHRAKEPIKPGGKDPPEKPPVPKTSPEQDVRKMQGRWKIVAAEDEGQDAQEELKAIKVVITGNKIVFHNGENDLPEMIVSLHHPDKRPKEIDLTLRADGKDKALLGFTSRALLVLQRAKEPAKPAVKPPHDNGFDSPQAATEALFAAISNQQ